MSLRVLEGHSGDSVGRDEETQTTCRSPVNALCPWRLGLFSASLPLLSCKHRTVHILLDKTLLPGEYGDGGCLKTCEMPLGGCCTQCVCLGGAAQGHELIILMSKRLCKFRMKPLPYTSSNISPCTKSVQPLSPLSLGKSGRFREFLFVPSLLIFSSP